MSDRPIVGWQRRRWKTKTECRTCPRRIRQGVTHVRDKADPPLNAMCAPCYTLLMEDGEAFEAQVLPRLAADSSTIGAN